MAKTIRPYTSDGVRVLYPVDFVNGIIRREHVYVYLTAAGYETQLAYTWISDVEIQLDAPVAISVEFNIRRIVPRDTLVNDYEDGAILKERNLDDSYKQSIMILEEIEDGWVTGPTELLTDLIGEGGGTGTAVVVKGTVVATEGQTVFVASEYVIGGNNLNVYINGVRQNTSAYTEATTTSFTLAEGVDAGDEVEYVVNQFPALGEPIVVTSAEVSHDGSTVEVALDALATASADFATLAAAVADTESLSVGKVIHLTERAVGKDGSSTWDVVLSTAVTENTYDIVQCVGFPLLSLVLRAELPLNLAVVGMDKDATTDGERTINSNVLNFAFAKYDEIHINNLIRTYGEVFVKDGLKLTGTTSTKAGILGYHPTEPTLTDASILAGDDQNNNTWNMSIENLDIQAINATRAIYITPYQCKFVRNRFSCPNGVGIKFHDGGYQVENEFTGNYFVNCETGVEAFGGFRNPTDQYFTANYFYSGSPIVSNYHIRHSNASGSLYTGNHYYGGSNNAYVRISASENIRFVGEYHEENRVTGAPDKINPQMEIIGGNPNTISLSGCSFWKGTGSLLDYNGDAACSIKITLNAFNPFQMSISDCTWRGGGSGFTIFGFTSGTSTDTNATNINFSSSNIVSGTYQLLKKLGTSAVAGNIVTTSHPYFSSYVTTQNGDYVNHTGGEIFSGNTGSATSSPVLAGSTAWLDNKPLIINNIATTTELSFSIGGGLSIGGLNPVPVGTRVAIVKDPTGVNDVLIYKH